MRSLDDDSPDPGETTPPTTPTTLGAPLRDAAVDPAPGDYLPPTGAGTADPHSEAVVSPTLAPVQGEAMAPTKTSKGKAKPAPAVDAADDDATAHLQSRANRR